MPNFNIDDEALVSAIEKRPEIYDRNHQNYTNRNVISALWEQIAQEVGSNEADLRKRWTNMRDYFTKINKFSDKHGSKRQRWYMYRKLQFLLPFVKQNRDGASNEDSLDRSWNSFPSFEVYTVNNVEGEEGHAVDGDGEGEDDDDDGPQPVGRQHYIVKAEQPEPQSTPITVASSSTSRTPTISAACTSNTRPSSARQVLPQKQRRKRRLSEEIDHDHNDDDADDTDVDYYYKPPKKRLQSPKVLQTSNTEAKKEEDPDELFLRSLLPKMKLLNTVDKMKFQIEILRTLLNFVENKNAGQEGDEENCRTV